MFSLMPGFPYALMPLRGPESHAKRLVELTCSDASGECLPLGSVEREDWRVLTLAVPHCAPVIGQVRYLYAVSTLAGIAGLAPAEIVIHTSLLPLL